MNDSSSTKKPEANSMTVGQFLKTAAEALAAAEVESARLDCLVLLEDTLGKNRANLLAHPEMPLSPAQLAVLNKNIAQRKKHVPLAYIRGKSEFYGREFAVNKHVLVPRPETESIITLLKNLRLNAHPRLTDIGCGSGCVGITAALELTDAEVSAFDIDANALAITQKNAQSLHAVVRLRQQDLLGDAHEQFDVVMANLPYVPDDYPINKAAMFEPALALFAGVDGLDLYRRLFDQLAQTRPSYIITEALEQQHTPLAQLAKTAGYKLLQTDGLAQLFALAYA